MDYIGIRVATSIPQPFQFEPGDEAGFSDSIARYFTPQTRRKFRGRSKQGVKQRSRPVTARNPKKS
jgi:hypothetical protein